MKNLILVLMMVAHSISALAQDVVATQTGGSQSFSFTNYLKDNSWVYVSGLFVVLLVVLVTAYYFGWDKKLFKHKAGDDNNQWFI